MIQGCVWNSSCFTTWTKEHCPFGLLRRFQRVQAPEIRRDAGGHVRSCCGREDKERIGGHFWFTFWFTFWFSWPMQKTCPALEGEGVNKILLIAIPNSSHEIVQGSSPCALRQSLVCLTAVTMESVSPTAMDSTARRANSSRRASSGRLAAEFGEV